MNINIYDVSKKAGVSIATVSRVLNGNTRVSEKTRDKVINAMKELDYTPNVFARGLGLNTMKTIGIMCIDSSDIYLANAVYYLEQELRKYNYDSILCCTGKDYNNKKNYLELLKELTELFLPVHSLQKIPVNITTTTLLMQLKMFLQFWSTAIWTLPTFIQ